MVMRMMVVNVTMPNSVGVSIDIDMDEVNQHIEEQEQLKEKIFDGVTDPDDKDDVFGTVMGNLMNMMKEESEKNG